MSDKALDWSLGAYFVFGALALGGTFGLDWLKDTENKREAWETPGCLGPLFRWTPVLPVFLFVLLLLWPIWVGLWFLNRLSD